MNDIQKKAFQILCEFDKVCRDHGIQYYLYAGSLLGAVRHSGFIPWDDDIDVVVLRKDYEKLQEIGYVFFDDRFLLQTIYSDPFTNNSWIKLHDINTAFISGFRRDGVMEGICIDIFPIDNVPNNRIIRYFRGKIINQLNFIYQYRFAKKFSNCSMKMRIFRFLIKLLPPINEMKFKVKYENYIKKYNDSVTKYVVYNSNRDYFRKIIPKKYLDSYCYVDFEGKKFPAPSNYSDILNMLYGENYMKIPPIEKQKSVHGAVIIDCNNSWKNYIKNQVNMNDKGDRK